MHLFKCHRHKTDNKINRSSCQTFIEYQFNRILIAHKEANEDSYAHEDASFEAIILV